ncbi:hypothetical protein GCM10027614_20310 [Micromonospora vulcania]
MGNQPVGERPPPLVIEAVDRVDGRADVTPDQELQWIVHAPTSTGVATIVVASACLQGPR